MAVEPRSTSKPIEDYGLIGNMLSAALVARDGSIDWLCLPRFDSPACFAALVGTPDNGRWKIAPVADSKVSRQYVRDTAILETLFETASGAIALTDFMPLSDAEDEIDLVRIVTGISGEVEVEMQLVIRFGYGEAVPWVRRRDYGLSAVAGPDAVELHTDVELVGKNMETHARFTVGEGESVPFTLSYRRSHQSPHFVSDRSESMERTTAWWREWVKRGSFEKMPAHWREPVVRSLITLKMLTYAPTGGIIAAPTTSLPEEIGGVRNWDYRYCWLRDSALTLYALLNAGYREEAEAWRQWLLRAVAGHPQQLQIMYGLGGERSLPERKLEHLAGYEGSVPVRVGNAAAGQTQLDVYGELLDTLSAARDADLQPHSEAWQLQWTLLDHLQENWRTLDHGIWEMRGPKRAFTHSRLMGWVAFNRAVTSIDRLGLDGPWESWRATMEEIRADICGNGFDSEMNSFVQYYGAKAVDASLLLIPQTGFLPADDPRVRGTIAAVERELMHDGLVKRYSTEASDDGIAGSEGTFLVCSFWLADAYVLCGRYAEAQNLFDRLLGLANDLGLLAEEYDPVAGRLLGNFPQGFSHIGLINTAHNLVESSGPARQRAHQSAPTDLRQVKPEDIPKGENRGGNAPSGGKA